MNRQEIIKLVGNKFFTATFTKKDGTLRKLNCRLGVKKHLTGGGAKYDAAKYDLLTVYDLKKQGYRTINLKTLQSIKSGGTELSVKYE